MSELGREGKMVREIGMVVMGFILGQIAAYCWRIWKVQWEAGKARERYEEAVREYRDELRKATK